MEMEAMEEAELGSGDKGLSSGDKWGLAARMMRDTSLALKEECFFPSLPSLVSLVSLSFASPRLPGELLGECLLGLFQSRALRKEGMPPPFNVLSANEPLTLTLP
jgi:hypothetical protein